MFDFLKSDWLKEKYSFRKKIVWIAPSITIVLALFLMRGNSRFLIEGSFNWWYSTILPATVAIICSFVIAKEKQKNYHGLFAIATSKSKLWISKIIICSLLLLATCLLFLIILESCAMIFNINIPLFPCLLASIVLFLTFVWQIPLLLFISLKIQPFIVILVSLFLNIGIGIFCATESYWWIPFSIPSRLMTPILGVLPNGVMAEATSYMRETSVIPLGISINVILFLVFCVITTIAFNGKEV